MRDGSNGLSICNYPPPTPPMQVREGAKTLHSVFFRSGGRGHNGRKSLILAPQEIPDISGYQWGFGCQFVKAYITENPVTNQKIL